MTATQQDIPKSQKIIAILWPSFLSAGVATILFFTTFDPQLMMALGGFEQVSRLGGYTIGFFLFWLLTASTGALMCYFQRPCHELTESELVKRK